MERDYWLGRKRSSFMLAGQATSSEARLIHYELAGLYSVKAARSPRAGAATSRCTAPIADAVPARFTAPPRDDAQHYGELALGAEYLASETTDAAEMAEHNRMAAIYLARARDAAWGECLSS